MGQLQSCEAHVRHPCDADMGLFSWLPHGRENTLRIKTGKEKNEMKWTDMVIKRMLQTFAGPENNFNFEA